MSSAWTAIDRDSKLIISYLIGGRDAGYAHEFMQDVAGRVANRIQLTTDGRARSPRSYGADTPLRVFGHASRMTGLSVVKTLTRKYAHLRGEWEHADRDIEDVYGLDAIDAATAEIVKRKKAIHKQLEAIEIVIHLYDPAWDFAKVRPIKPVKIKHKAGDISQRAYDVLRERNNEPATGTQLGRGVLAKLGIAQPSGVLVARYADKISTTFSRRPDVVKVLQGLPRRWMLKRFVPLPSSVVSSSSRPKIEKQGVQPQRAKAG